MSHKILLQDWLFTKTPLTATPVTDLNGFIPVSIPHSFNALDGQDGGGDYFRGKCWYVKELPFTETAPGMRTWIEFEAASAYAEVYVNGKRFTTHAGGYSTFRADITEGLTGEHDVISVMVSNEPREDIYPQIADFTFYGGLYREVSLLQVPETHFDLDYHGSPAVTAASSLHADFSRASLTFHAYVTNPQEGDFVQFTVLDASGTVIAEVNRPAQADTEASVFLMNPHLWNGVRDPYLYTVQVLLTRHNEILDERCFHHGIRTFHADPQKGFFLNGNFMPLRGVSRHQDRLGKGNALTRAEHEEDARMIAELGANTVRLAHYQHSRYFYDACDRLGLIVWAEIPFISAMNVEPAAHQNCISQMTELICQNYHHPCICFWGISNEITIGGGSEGLVENLKDLNSLVHKLDPTRLSTMAQVSMLPMNDEQNQITDVLSYNHYFGWYGGKLTDNEAWLDAFHRMHPNRALGISEYGCEGIVTYHSDEPKAGDYSEEYQALYHEHMIKVINDRPWLWATHIWNMFDFGCDAREEGGVAGRNNKGLVTMDRMRKKDSYYLYQAHWSTVPMVHICSKRYAKRTADTIAVKVYSNQPEVTLYVNGSVFRTLRADKIFCFEQVPLNAGFTTITAATGTLTDTTCFEKVTEAYAPYHYVDPDAGDGPDAGVANWFDMPETAAETDEPMTFDPAYFSIKDKLRDILKNDEAAAFITNLVQSALGIKLKKAMLMMVAGKSLEELAGMIPATGDIDKEGMMKIVNAQLQKIKK